MSKGEKKRIKRRLTGSKITSVLSISLVLLLVGVALRLLRIRDLPVADLLPALFVAPLLTALVAAF